MIAKKRDNQAFIRGFSSRKQKYGLLSSKSRNSTGFTLIELLIVIGIISIIAAAIIVAISPGEKMGSARESTRAAHFSAIGPAFYSTMMGNNGLDSIAEILEEADCNGDDGDTSTSLSWDSARDFTDNCAGLIGLGSAPEDPEETASYRVRATSGDIAGRLLIYTTATGSEWQEGNPAIY